MPDSNERKPMDAVIIVPYMPKGGVGKTTTAVHLGYALSEYGKTLLIDADPQGNLTNHLLSYSAFNKYNKNLLEYLNGDRSFNDSLIEARMPNNVFKGLYLLGTPSNYTDFSDYIQHKFPKSPARLNNIKKSAINAGFKFIIFDPPASLYLYTRIILSISTHVVPIIEPENFGYDALISLFNEMKDIKEGYDVEFDNSMAIVNKFDKRSATHRYFLEKVKTSPFDPIFVINDVKSIPNASAQHLILQEYKSDNQANVTYNEIAVYFNNELRL